MSAWIVSKKHIDYIVTAHMASLPPEPNPEKAAFLKALLADPRDEACRLVFADWCEEHGYRELAGELRLGITPADKIGRMLWRENLLSVAYRYPGDGDGDRPGPTSFRDSQVDTYTYAPTPLLEGEALRKTLACYDYQSCEHPGWKTSEAAALVARIMPAEDKGKRAEWDATPWGWAEDNGFSAPPLAPEPLPYVKPADAIKRIRSALKARCKSLSVRMGRGTAYGWIEISGSGEQYGEFTPHEASVLKELEIPHGLNFANMASDTHPHWIKKLNA